MAVIENIKGTLYPSFTIGNDGATIYQGTSLPVNGSGISGDLYIYANGSASEIYQNQNGTWSAGAGGGISSLTAGSGLSGGTITSSGTISLSTVGTAGTYNNVTTDSFGRVTAGSNVSYLTTNQNITLSGDVTGSGGTAITATLGTSGVTAGTYGDSTHTNTITVDAKGRITNIATNLIPVGTGTLTSIVAGTDLTGGTITQTGTINLATQSSVTAGTYGDTTHIPQVTINSKGIVTSVSNVSVSIPNAVVVAAGSNVTVGSATTGGTTTYTVNGQPSGTGTVTSVNATGSNGVSVTGGPITGSGSLSITLGAITPTSVAATGTISATNFSGTHSGNSSGTNTGDQTITLTGDVTGSGTGSITATLGSVVTAGTYNQVVVGTKGLVTSGNNVGYLTSNQTITISGDASGAGSTAIALTLGTSGVTAGTYGDTTHIPTVVVNAKGLVTSISTNAITYGTGSVTNIATGTGLTGGPITNTGTIAMGTSGVSAGTYGAGTTFPQIIVDTLGRVTSATTVALGSIASQGSNSVSITGGTITGLPTPVNSSDAATKSYVDSATAGLSAKGSVRLATTGNNLTSTYSNGTSGVGATLTLTATGLLTIDQSTVVVGDRILVKDQTNGSENGIYSVTVAGAVGTSAVLTRTTDFNSTSTVFNGAYTVVETGTINKGTLWLLTSNGEQTYTIGTTALSFTELAVANQSIAFTGDVTGTGAGTVNLTLGSVNSTVGTFGNTTNIPTVTVNSKGLITNISNTSITYGTGSVTQIIAGSQLTGGTINGTGTIALGTTGVTAGTYQGLVVNAYGQITSAANQSYLTANQNITVTGDVSGNGSTALTLTLGTTGVTAGTGYNTFTVNAKGLITSASTTGYLTSNQTITVTGDATGSGSTAISLTLGSVNSNVGTFTAVTVGSKGLVTAAGNLVATGDATGTASGTSIALTLGSVATAGTYNQVVVGTKGLVTSGTNIAYLTANQNITVTGDVTGSGSTALSLTLGTSGVTAGTGYNTFTVNSKGLITSASTVATGTGSVTSIIAGTGLTGGTINGTGTIAIGTTGVTAGTYNTVVVNALGQVTVGSNASVGTGNVVGTANTYNQELAVFNGTTGTSISGGGITIGSNQVLTVPKSSNTINSKKYVSYGTTTNATATQIYLDGASAQIVLANNTTVRFESKIVGRATGANAGSNFIATYKGGISRNGSAATTALVSDIETDVIINPNTLPWAVSFAADTTNGALSITVTGQASTNIVWGVVTETIEVTG
jgi:hypothetical protein